MELQDMRKVSKIIAEIENRLVDELSRELFYIRLQNLFYRNENELIDSIFDLGEKYNWLWTISKLDKMCESITEKAGIIIFGCGIKGKQTCRLIKGSKYRDISLLFCDNKAANWGAEIMGCKVISPHQLEAQYRDHICIVGSSVYRQSIFEQLIEEGFPLDHIMYPGITTYGTVGWQYFDYLCPEEDEVFIDGGAYDGASSGDFVKWTNGKYKAIYAFEANPYCIDKCRNFYSDNNIQNVEFIRKGLWNKKARMGFAGDFSQASRLSENGNEIVDLDTIDNVLNGRKASFIKMDIEGAEYRALLGAKETIKKYRPKMALSVYHKPQDIIEIPTLLLEYHEDYKFALRQYSSIGDETVLYAH
jgi:FkbM family methyltransferase